MRSRTALLLLVLLAGCDHPEGQLTLRLLRTSFEDPFLQVNELLVRVLGPDLQPRSEIGPTALGARLELGLVGGGPQRLEVLGRGGDETRARGVTRQLSVTAERTQELLPFARESSAAMAAIAALGLPRTVDGSLAEWQISPAVVLDENNVTGGPALSGARDLRAEVYLAWGESELRFAIAVTDDCPVLHAGVAGPCGTASRPDRLALGFDAKGDGGDAFGSDDLWVEIQSTQLTVVEGYINRADLQVVVAPLPDGTGWVAEGSLNLAALGRAPLKLGERMGFDVVILDEDPNQAEPTRLAWSTWPGPDPTAPVGMGRIGPGQTGP